LLAPAALERFRTALSGPSSVHSSRLVGGQRTVQATRVISRPLAAVTSGVLALGVITAAVLGGSSTVTGQVALPHDSSTLIPSQAPTGIVANPDTAAPAAGTSTPPSGSLTTPNPSATGVPPGPDGTTNGTPGTPGGSGGQRGGTPSGPTPNGVSPGVASPPPAGGSGPTPARPALQVNLGANLSAATAAVGLGVGNNSCIGVSLNGTKSCATPAPKTPGLSLSVATPGGTIKL
jgi:hypothetical protein